jgi:hypothetical protein
MRAIERIRVRLGPIIEALTRHAPLWRFERRTQGWLKFAGPSEAPMKLRVLRERSSYHYRSEQGPCEEVIGTRFRLW